ncbi:hypothetical protein NE237_004360 [Protea cynaroides]|uniref:Uncharacterized protein n=1 Tax=Protea cynaroides TaxID=273540 RepID=A0A9Q0KIU8_9MAGN|nr:hypothetical protein NE237_004360 [Protea cynaroides]
MGVAAAHCGSLKGCGRIICTRRDFPPGCGRKSSATGKFRRRRISVIRNFPPGCGRKASFVTAGMNLSAETVTDDTKQAREKVLEEGPPSIGLKENIVIDMAYKVELESEGDVGREEHVEVRTTSLGNLNLKDPQQTSSRLDWESNLYPPQSTSQSAIKNVEGSVGNLKGEIGKEGVEHCKKSLKITFPMGGSGDENDAINKCPREQSVGVASSGKKVPEEQSLTSNPVNSSSRNNVKRHELVAETALGPSDNRVIVQALMAAPNCPWRQGKQRNKGNLNNTEKPCRKK